MMIFEDLLLFLPGGRIIRNVLKWTARTVFSLRGRVPWSFGFYSYRNEYLIKMLSDSKVMDGFAKSEKLPGGYGVGIDERCIEYPWVISHLRGKNRAILDAGSTLNHKFLLELSPIKDQTVHILTLSPEKRNYWYRKVSYIYDDLRRIPIKDDFYDTIVCISTLEHVGFDNIHYTGSEDDVEHKPDDYLIAIGELSRVLKPGGELFLTVPFGWIEPLDKLRVFDQPTLKKVIDRFDPGSTEVVYYRYDQTGWQVSDAESVKESKFADWKMRVDPARPKRSMMPPDRAAAARAVACLRLVKKG